MPAGSPSRASPLARTRNELFSGAAGVSRESLMGWFDKATATFGGRDVADMKGPYPSETFRSSASPSRPTLTTLVTTQPRSALKWRVNLDERAATIQNGFAAVATR
jgi:hypothetical protein